MGASDAILSPVDLKNIELALGCSGLLINVRNEWGSSADSDHRLKIRAALAATTMPEPQPEPGSGSGLGLGTALGLGTESLLPNWVTSLEILPHLPFHYCSISHGRRNGGFALCDKCPTITGFGFDLESLSRLAPAVITRISKAEERAAAPDPRFLWSAKEAAFKGTFGHSQPIAITEIKILDWSAPLNDFYTFHARSNRRNFGRGVLKLDPRNDEVFALFVGIS